MKVFFSSYHITYISTHPPTKPHRRLYLSHPYIFTYRITLRFFALDIIIKIIVIIILYLSNQVNTIHAYKIQMSEFTSFFME